MKFTLTYDGELKANSPKQKWEIRKAFAPQLEELRRINPGLSMLAQPRHVPITPGIPVWEVHHSADARVAEILDNYSSLPSDWIDVCRPVVVKDRQFLPIVRNSLALKCGLKIIFLRKEESGRVYQGGDMDNRLKTLFDARSVPNKDQLVDDPSVSDPIHCLLEDDALISGIYIETQRLLGKTDGSKHEVRLIIEVDVRVAISRTYNQLFLGE